MKIINVKGTRVKEEFRSCQGCGEPTTTVVSFLTVNEGAPSTLTGEPFCDACFAKSEYSVGV
jgi:hypothetical protein